MKSSTMKTILKALHILLLVTVSVASQAAVESNTYILTDHLGSPILATDENGDTLWREDYQPYGTQLTNEDGDNSVGFTGHKDDKALGVTYMQGRWYHQDMGRFLAIDPVGFVEGNPASFNRYAYANSNPYLFIDPDGNQPSYSHIGPYLRGQYRRGELLAWQMMGRTYLEEGVYAAAGGAIGKVAGKVIKEGVKHAAPHIRNLVRNNNVTKGLAVPKNLPKNIHPGQQGKHIPGHNNYTPGRSPLAEGVNPQKLLDGVQSGAHPIVRMTPRGQPVVDFGKAIGQFEGKATNFGIIHHGKKGAHIVPANPVQF